MICRYIQAFANTPCLIRVYTSSICAFKTRWKKMHNYRIQTDDLMHTIRRSYRLTTSMNTSVLLYFVGSYL